MAAKDVERLQREISEKVVGTFGGERMRAEIGRANKAPSAEPTAWQLVQRRDPICSTTRPASIAASTPLLRRAIELDPKYAIAYATLGLITAEKTLNALSADPAADRKSAIDTIARAERLAPRDPVVLRAAGCVHAYTGEYRRSIELLRRAVKLAPYDLGTWGYLGWPLVATGQARRSARIARDRRPPSRDLCAASRTRLLGLPQVGRTHVRRRVRARSRARARNTRSSSPASRSAGCTTRMCSAVLGGSRMRARPWSSALRTTRS